MATDLALYRLRELCFFFFQFEAITVPISRHHRRRLAATAACSRLQVRNSPCQRVVAASFAFYYTLANDHRIVELAKVRSTVSGSHLCRKMLFRLPASTEETSNYIDCLLHYRLPNRTQPSAEICHQTRQDFVIFWNTVLQLSIRSERPFVQNGTSQIFHCGRSTIRIISGRERRATAQSADPDEHAERRRLCAYLD